MKKKEIKKLLEQLQVTPGEKVRLKRYDPAWRGTSELKELTKGEIKSRAQQFLNQNLAELSAAQQLLWANDTHSVLIVLQAMDAAGKDGMIKHVMSGVNPQGCQIYSFKAPSAEDLDHPWLWRYMQCLPERGRICIFNRSHYEEVLVVKVHPELLAKQRIPREFREGKAIWKDRYEDINAFEKHLWRNGTVVLKFFLHLSKGEQKRRFLERLDNPEKHWKFSASDVAERAHWDKYQEAFEDALSATSTPWAPWHVIPADNKWVARSIVAELITSAINSLDLKFPEPTAEQIRQLAQARRQLRGDDA